MTSITVSAREDATGVRAVFYEGDAVSVNHAEWIVENCKREWPDWHDWKVAFHEGPQGGARSRAGRGHEVARSEDTPGGDASRRRARAMMLRARELHAVECEREADPETPTPDVLADFLRSLAVLTVAHGVSLRYCPCGCGAMMVHRAGAVESSAIERGLFRYEADEDGEFAGLVLASEE